MTRKKTNRIVLILFVAALAVFLFAAVKLGTIFFGYYKEDSAYKELEAFADFEEEQPAEEGTLYHSPIDFESLLAINQETIAWIHFETMEINYPIVQGTDDDYYLHHGFYKEENKCGCIFMDTEASPDFSSDHSFLYGHNMKNKSMFAKLNDYAEESFFQENKTFLIYTPTETRRYEIYSCYIAELGMDSFTYSFDDKESYAGWQKTVKGRSLYDTGVTPDPAEPTVTLMTCTPKGSNYRFLVHGRLIG